jgi:hypothetical protein
MSVLEVFVAGDASSRCVHVRCFRAEHPGAESQIGIRIHWIRIRIPASDSVEFRRHAHLGYRLEGIDAYPQMYPHEAVAAGGRCWTLMDETAAYKYEA